MPREKVIEVIAEILGIPADEVVLEAVEKYRERADGKPFYTRVRLIDTFERRGAFCKEPELADSMKQFAQKLMSLSNDDQLFFWKYQNDDVWWGGWAIESELLWQHRLNKDEFPNLNWADA